MHNAKLLTLVCFGNLIVVLTMYQMNEDKRRCWNALTSSAVQSVPLDSSTDHVIITADLVANVTNSTQDYIHPG